MSEIRELFLLRGFFDPSTVNTTGSQVEPELFMDPNRKLMASTLCSMFATLEEITPETVVVRLMAQSNDTEDDARARVDQVMAEPCPTAGEVASLVKSISIASVRKSQKELGEWLSGDMGQRATPAQVQAKINDYTVKSAVLSDQRTETFADGLKRIIESNEARVYYTMGFGELDDRYRIYPHSFNVVMADSGVGKTSYLLNAALNLAKQGVTSFVHSIELDLQSVQDRLAAMACGITCTDIGRGLLTQDQRSHMAFTLQQNRDVFSRIVVMAPNSIACETIHSTIINLTNQYGEGIHWIDYLQSMTGAAKHVIDTTSLQAHVSSTLTKAAKATGMPIVALSQVTNGSLGMDRIAGSKQSKRDAFTILELSREDNEIEVNDCVRITAKLLKGRKDGVMKTGVELYYNLKTQRIFFS